jgi:hypothetical protein
LKFTLFIGPDSNRRANERLQGMKRDPDKRRLNWVSAEITETE